MIKKIILCLVLMCGIAGAETVPEKAIQLGDGVWIKCINGYAFLMYGGGHIMQPMVSVYRITEPQPMLCNEVFTKDGFADRGR